MVLENTPSARSSAVSSIVLLMFNNALSDHVSLETAAYSVGFTNYSNFYRLYKKYMGLTPLEFKQQMGNAVRDTKAEL